MTLALCGVPCPTLVTDDAIVAAVACWDDGVSGTHLVGRLVSEGGDRAAIQRAVQRALDRGKVCLGPGLRIYLPDHTPLIADLCGPMGRGR